MTVDVESDFCQKTSFRTKTNMLLWELGDITGEVAVDEIRGAQSDRTLFSTFSAPPQEVRNTETRAVRKSQNTLERNGREGRRKKRKWWDRV